MRIDKFIWCVRLIKTRSLATKLCSQEKVCVNDDVVKASRTVKVNDEISLKNGPVWRSYRILDIPKSRLGAKLVPDYLLETTEAELLETLQRIEEENRENRKLGFRGRPTKKDRRNMDRYRRD